MSDSGIGIPADKQGAIFDRFYQVSSPDKGNPVVGTGIGLHLCREFVRMHHGTITVKSEPGAGSTFTVTLPVIPLDNQDIISAPEGIAEGISCLRLSIRRSLIRMRLRRKDLRCWS